MFNFSVEKICEIAAVPIPSEVLHKKAEIIPYITCSSATVQKGCAFFSRGLLENGQPASEQLIEKNIRIAYEKGAAYVVCKKKYFTENGQEIPCIVVDNPLDVYIKICNLKKSSFNVKTVAITGSVGKTTTKEMFTLVASEKYKTLFSRENANGFASISRYIQMLDRSTEVYIQEVGAFHPGLVKNGAEMLKPDACIITNIGTPHIDLYGSIENILEDKLSLAKGLPNNGMAFLNLDDEIISQVKLDCAVTWFSANNPAADYYAKNVSYENGYIIFDIAFGNNAVSVRLKGYGIHNIINAVAAFAFGKWLNLSNNDIVIALEKYEGTGLRQNFCNIGGYQLYVDCYNSAPNSIVGSVETLLRIPIAENNKRIVVFGDIPRLGKDAEKIHKECGEILKKFNIDLYLFFGRNAKYTADILKQSGKKALHTNNREQLNQWLLSNVELGDLILFKAGHPSHLAKTIDQVFGTSFHITDGDIILDTGKDIENEKFRAKEIDGIVEIRKYKSKETKVEVPGSLNNKPVVRIGNDAFCRNNAIKDIVISEGICNIGIAAFYICTHLKNVTLPSTLKVIERSAFNYCIALEEVFLPDSVLSIGRRAFYDCKKLKKIVIGRNVNFIDADAFYNCPHLHIYGYPDTYAEKYAIKNNIPFISLVH